MQDTSIALDSLDLFADLVYNNAVNKGFWDEDNPNPSEKLMLVVSELAEIMEALREGNPPSVKIPEFSKAEEEVADVFIRMMDLCKGFGWRISESIVAKYNYNLSRPRMHGKLF